MCRFRLSLCVLLAISANAGRAASEKAAPLVGQSEAVYTLAAENGEIRGLDVDDFAPKTPRLLVLDRSCKVFIYQLPRDRDQAAGELKLARALELPKGDDGGPLESPRGLAFAREDGREVVYFLNWHVFEEEGKKNVKSQLWRLDLEDRTSTCVDLSRYPFRIGDREVLDLACDNGKLLVSFDASAYTSHNLRVQRGIVQLQWNREDRDKLAFVRHMPDSG
ncbi:MAG: hypothetical protein HQ582_05325, partial [Planctomycetes bacterium]|nr:hypothetical protein [Planctomycetota bacterium]